MENIKNNKCEVCKTNDFKYKCPKCTSRTCSLVCVKKHKQNKTVMERKKNSPIAIISLKRTFIQT